MLRVSVCCSPLSTSASMLTKAAPIGSVCQFTYVQTSMTEARIFLNRKYRGYSSENPLPQLLRPPQNEYINPNDEERRTMTETTTQSNLHDAEAIRRHSATN